MKRSIIIAVAISILAFTCPAYAQVADVPRAIPYSGYLTDAGGIGVNSDVQVEVRLYDSLIAGLGQGVTNSHVLYAEMHPAVAVERGNFRVAIGEGASLDAGWVSFPLDPLIEKENTYLELWVNGERLSPRQRMGAIPAALRVQHAKYADELVVMPPIDEGMMPTYPATRITSGIFNESQMPNLDASRIIGMLASNQLPDIPVSKFTTTGEQFALNQLDNMNAGKITTGTLGLDRLPESTYLSSDDFAIQMQSNLGGMDGTYFSVPSGFSAAECRTLFSPVDARPVNGIDRLDMWINSTGTFYCTVNEHYDDPHTPNQWESCVVSAFTLCKRGGF